MATLPVPLQSIIAANSTIYKEVLTGKAIRIMKLHPGSGDDDILCSLIVVNIDHVGPFHALSYCWGTNLADNPITCNGERFQVTSNLYSALQQLRLESEAQYMWIDAVCINQNSIPERNHQVPYMRQIYQMATQVTVWLGDEDDSTHIALATMESVFESCCLTLYGPESRKAWLQRLEDEESWEALRTDVVKTIIPNRPEDPKACAKALRTFFDRAWFSRIWVIQEVRGCPNILVKVGRRTVPWDIVALSAAWIVYGPSSVTKINEPYKFRGFLNADLMRQKLMATKNDVPFIELLDRCRNFKCTVDTDRIFALLQHATVRQSETRTRVRSDSKDVSVATESGQKHVSHLGLDPDYAMPLFEVYRQIVLRSISEFGSLQVLCHAYEDHKYRAGYPSWMPVWHKISSRFMGPRRNFLYNASRGCSPQLVAVSAPSLLGLRGVVVGEVISTDSNIRCLRKTSNRAEVEYGTSWQEIIELSKLIVRDCWQPEDNWLQDPMIRTSSNPDLHFNDFCAFVTEKLEGSSAPNIISLHGKWCDICMSRHTVSPAEDLQIMHCETCLDFDMCLQCHKAGHMCPGKHVLSARPIPSLICQFDGTLLSRLEQSKGNGNSKRFDLGARQTFDGCSFIRVDSGHLGIGKDVARSGDLVVVLFGARVPFIVRKRDEHYEIIGDCYIHNMMDGEAIDAWREGKFREETFILS